MIPPTDVKEKLAQEFPGAVIEIADLTGGMDHYRIVIEWSGFSGLSSVARHRLVHSALREELKGPIHAITLQLSEGALAR